MATVTWAKLGLVVGATLAAGALLHPADITPTATAKKRCHEPFRHGRQRMR